MVNHCGPLERTLASMLPPFTATGGSVSSSSKTVPTRTRACRIQQKRRCTLQFHQLVQLSIWSSKSYWKAAPTRIARRIHRSKRELSCATAALGKKLRFIAPLPLRAKRRSSFSWTPAPKLTRKTRMAIRRSRGRAGTCVLIQFLEAVLWSLCDPCG